MQGIILLLLCSLFIFMYNEQCLLGLQYEIEVLKSRISQEREKLRVRKIKNYTSNTTNLNCCIKEDYNVILLIPICLIAKLNIITSFFSFLLMVNWKQINK